MTNEDSPFNTWTRLWMESSAQAMQAFFPLAGSTESPELVRQGRAKLLEIWSQSWEQWMRSPAFLDAQKQMLDGNLAVRKQFRSVMRRMQRELQLAGREDIDALEAAIRRSERRILDQLEETAAQLRALEAKIDRLGRRAKRPPEKSSDSANGARRKRRSADKTQPE